MDKLIRSVLALDPVPPAAAREYQENLAVMREQVDRELASHPHIHRLIGLNPLETMYDKHRYHARFMANVLQFNAFEMLAKTAQWSYQRYHAHGFSYEYFPVELKAWRKAVARHLEASLARVIDAIYQWLADHHKELVISSRKDLSLALPLDPSRNQDRETFWAPLLYGDYRECLRLMEHAAISPAALEDFYLQVIQPCMYRVGQLWQRGKISVAHEHLATAIASRVMTAAYLRVETMNPLKGKVVTTTAPQEYHEMGARIIADCLALDGWEVDYLGANTPPADLMQYLAGVKPFLVAVSVAVPCNLSGTRDTLRSIKDHPDLGDVRIMVGGRLFLAHPNLWLLTGADGWAPTSKKAVALARDWWEKRPPDSG